MLLSPFGSPSPALVAQTVKNPPAMQETKVWSLGQKDPLEKEMATHSSILAWRIPWAEEPGELQVLGVAKSWTQLSDSHKQEKWDITGCDSGPIKLYLQK